MNWQDELIAIYLYICKHYQKDLWLFCQRMSNNSKPKFTDEEVITLYLFGIIDKKTEIKTIYEYANRHLRDWFPNLPSYVAFVQRLNRVSNIFPPILEKIQSEEEKQNPTSALLIDSFPVSLAKQGHRFKACVAKEFANSGYCSTKKLYFYGVRVHVIARRHAGTLPKPEYIGVTPASHHDGKIFEQIRPVLFNEEIYGDKAYQLPDAKEIQNKQNLTVLTPVKKKKGQKYLKADEQWLSTAVSSVRQPIEALFAWISEKTDIENAGKVRSYNGLMIHVFGRLVAGLFFWNKLRTNP